jgi:hypothetical protein
MSAGAGTQVGVAPVWFDDPVIPKPTEAQVRALIVQHGSLAPRVLLDIENERRRLLRGREENPFEKGYVPPIWREAEALLWEALFLVLFGANRSSKTWFCVWAAIRHMVKNPKARVLFLHNDDSQSIDVHQAIFWHFMPLAWKPPPGKRVRKGDSKISYQAGDGFASDIVVFPNGSSARFGNYKQDHTRFEGAEYTLINASERFPLPLLMTLGFRLPGAGKVLRLLWDYSPIHGIEPNIDMVLTGATTVRSERAVHLPADHRGAMYQDWPLGDMPRLQQGQKPGLKILYFWSEDNKLAAGEALREKQQMERWDTVKIERRLYGFARNVIGKALPKFRKSNLIPLATLKARGLLSRDCTRRMIYDPAGARNPFIIWFSMDFHGRHAVYREWPDRQRFGEWAKPGASDTQWNGERGPAQDKLGLSIAQQKRMILEAEGWRWDDAAGEYEWAVAGVEPERITERLIDPRAGKAQRQTENEEEGETLIDLFAQEQKDHRGRVIGPAMHFEPAPGYQEEQGLDVMNGKFLGYDEQQPIEPLINEPLLYVAEECEQTTYSLLNYRPGRPATDQACKDPFDCVRYYCTHEVFYIPPGGLPSFGGRKGVRR